MLIISKPDLKSNDFKGDEVENKVLFAFIKCVMYNLLLWSTFIALLIQCYFHYRFARQNIKFTLQGVIVCSSLKKLFLIIFMTFIYMPPVGNVVHLKLNTGP